MRYGGSIADSSPGTRRGIGDGGYMDDVCQNK